MRILVAILGIALLLIVLWDAFETIVLPRRVTQAPADAAVLSLDVATVARRGAGAAQRKAPGILSQFFWSSVAALSSECVGSGTDRWIRAAVLVYGLGGDSLGWQGNLSHGPLPERHDVLHTGAGGRGAAHDDGATAHGDRRRHGLWLPRHCDRLSPRALSIVLAARSEHFAAGCARRFAADRR